MCYQYSQVYTVRLEFREHALALVLKICLCYLCLWTYGYKMQCDECGGDLLGWPLTKNK